MTFFKPAKYLPVLLFLILLGTSTGLSQSRRADFNRPQTFDVQHYLIRASFDLSKKQIFGDTTVSLRPIAGNFAAVELDAVNLSFESVTLEPSGTRLGYKTDSQTVLVTLDKAYSHNDLISIRFKYTATPKKGIYFVDAETRVNEVAHSAQIWTQGEPDEARHWFPSFDFPSDKATSEKYLTVEKDFTVVGNGELLDKTENADGTVTWHYKMPVPHSTYLLSFVVGKYIKLDDKYKDIPLAFYSYPGKESTAQRAFADTRKMIGVFEELTGVDFPFNKYDQTIVAKFEFGGMENITATTLADTEVFFADFDFGKNIVNDLVAHEVAHSWFGNLVTCKNWAELWLNEGFATYMVAAYRENVFGRSDYLGKIRSDAAEFLVDETVNRRRHGLFNLRAGDVGSLFDNSATTYNKGSVVLHMLREQIGREKFWKGVNRYLNNHKFENVETTDLKAAMEAESDQDLGWFFDQWVYGAGAPNLNVKQTYYSGSKLLKITISQIQKADGITPAVFRLPLDIDIKTANGVDKQSIEIKRRSQTFSFKIGQKPLDVVYDNDEKVPLKKLKVRVMASAK